MTANRDEFFLGIDVGTSGVRGLAVTGSGQVLARASVSLDLPADYRKTADSHEQPTDCWWTAFCLAIRQVRRQLDAAGQAPTKLRALAIDGTSGTLVCLDDQGRALRPALMYNDGRATTEAGELNRVAGPWCGKLGYKFAASYALARILWIRQHELETFAQTRHFVHQADYVVGRLSGEFGVTDYSNALKTGYDLVDDCWPAWIDRWDGIRQRLPRVVAPGTRIAQVSAAAAAETGLPAGLTIVAGVSDGTAGGIASGARKPGDGNTTLGTTLVFKTVSPRLCVDPAGLVYSHRLPNALWLPGAASNVGAEWITADFPGADPAELDRQAAPLLPVATVAYPLAHRGERFPFLNKQAEGFVLPEVHGIERYAACLQGTAFVERLGYEVLDRLTGVAGSEIYSTGAASRSDIWLQCRADVCGRVMHRTACPEAAFGSAILAAGGTVYDGLDEAITAMVRGDKTFVPQPDRHAVYTTVYRRFLEELKRRGYR